MTNPNISFRVWKVAGHETRIEFPHTVLEALRVAARLQIARTAVSPVDSRGILLGSRVGKTIHPTGSTPPGNVPEADESVVGWYAIRTPTDLYLTENDLVYMGRPEACDSDIALIVRAVGNEAIRIGVFFREDTGKIRSQSSYEELLVLPPPRVKEALVTTPPAEAVKLKPTPKVAQGIARATVKTPAAPRIPWRWGSLALGSIVGIILLMIGVIEFHTVGGSTVLATQPAMARAARPSVVRDTPNPGEAHRQRALQSAQKAEWAAGEAQRLASELTLQRDHNRRMEMFVEELRERAAAAPHSTKSESRARQSARSVRMEP